MDKEYTMNQTVPWPFEFVRRRQQRTSHGRKGPLSHSASDSEAKPSAEKSLSRFPPSGSFLVVFEHCRKQGPLRP